MDFSEIFKVHFEVIHDAREAIIDSHQTFSQEEFRRLKVEQCCLVDESELETVKQIQRPVSVRSVCESEPPITATSTSTTALNLCVCLLYQVDQHLTLDYR